MDDFATLWAGIELRLRRYLQRAQFPRDHLDDILQETFVLACRAFEDLADKKLFATWVHRIAYNEGIKLLRAKSYGTKSLDGAAEPQSRPPEAHARDWNYQKAIADAEGALLVSKVEADLIRLKSGSDHQGWAAVARRTGLTENNCAKIYSRGIEKFRVFLFCHRPDLCGSQAAIQAAFDKAARAEPDGLTAGERDAFENVILRRTAEPAARGYWTDLRSACSKVALFLNHLDFTEEP